MTTLDILRIWQSNDPVPDGWEVEADFGPEGGQPNGVGEIEPSDSRDWFSPMGETHHRERLVLTITGPWTEGPREWVADYQAKTRARASESARRDEDRILAEAERIRAARAAE